MSKSIEIKIALVVGDNGEFAAGNYKGKDTDWGFLGDCTGVYDPKTRDTTYPTSEKQYIVTTWVELPEIKDIATAAVEEFKP